VAFIAAIAACLCGLITALTARRRRLAAVKQAPSTAIELGPVDTRWRPHLEGEKRTDGWWWFSE
jgi:hypothetical protein